MKNALGRTTDYMRISVTDGCNLRCKHCMSYGVECTPRWDIPFLEKIRAVGIYTASLGVCHIKVTRGEPLVCRNCCQLVKQLKSIPGTEKMTITTNGVPLGQYLDDLTEAGVDGTNISPDTLGKDLYQRVTGIDALGIVTETVRRACAMPLSVRTNAVSIDFSQMDEEHQEVGRDDWRQMVGLAREYSMDAQFIEMTPIGYGRNLKTINRQELLEEMMKVYPCMKEDDRVCDFGPAVYYRIPGFRDSIGLISVIHGKFCSGYNRVRLTPQGYLKPCLCYEDGVDLRRTLKKGQERPKEEGYYRWPYAGCPSDGELQRELRKAMEQAVLRKPTAHCLERPGQVTEVYNMIVIGGQSICQSRQNRVSVPPGW